MPRYFAKSKNVDMPRPFRIRRIAKWTGLGMCALILMAWGFSSVYGVGVVASGDTAIILEHGWLSRLYHNMYYMDPSRYSFGRVGELWMHRASAGYYGSWTSTYPIVPLWILLLIASIPTAFLFHRDRSRKINFGHCAICHYELTGNTSGVCPECGAKVTVACAIPPQSPPSNPL